jgi:transposase
MSHRAAANRGERLKNLANFCDMDATRLSCNVLILLWSCYLDQHLRRILIVGAHSVLRCAKENPLKYPWLTQLLARRPFKVVAVALANKMARTAWALLAHGGHIGRLSLRPLHKRLGDGRMWVGMSVHELQG